MTGKIVPSHEEVRQLIDVIHYDTHPPRIESALFIHNKDEMHRQIKAGEIPPCFINNGYCEGQTEIHHYLVEYSAGNEVMWREVNGVLRLVLGKAVDIQTPDEKENLVPICHKHHMGVGTGIHMVTFPAWILQKFLNASNIALFEAAITKLKEERHPNHADFTHPDHLAVNAKAGAILHKLAA